MIRVLIAALFCFTITGCTPVRAVKERYCINTIAGDVTEHGRADEFVPPDKKWHIVGEAERKIVFSRLHRDCLEPKNVPMEKKFELAVRSAGESGYEIRVWPAGEDFNE